MGRAEVRPAVRALLAGLIDYAGLFPPASLSMAEAVARYARYHCGPHAWMLGRFIVPCRRLEELERQMPPVADGGAWRVSVLASDDLASDRKAIEDFNARPRDAVAGRACIDTVEARVESAQDVSRIAAALPRSLMLWFEVAPGPGPALHATLGAIAALGASAAAGAKLRTGGTTPDAIPPSDAIAHFLLACARAGVMCKATAGLHHPIRAPHRLTYADDSPTALMHGFVNLFLAAALACDLVSRDHADAKIIDTLVMLLEERDVHRVQWHDDRVEWRGHRVDADLIASTRERFARSFGSCSFDEPIDDLTQLGWWHSP